MGIFLNINQFDQFKTPKCVILLTRTRCLQLKTLVILDLSPVYLVVGVPSDIQLILYEENSIFDRKILSYL